MDDLLTPQQAAEENQQASVSQQLQSSSLPESSSLLSAEKLLIGSFAFFVGFTLLLIIIQSRWYYLTFVLSLVVVLITYKEGLVAMEEE